MSSNWRELLTEYQAEIVSDALERIRARHLPGYEALPQEELVRVVENGVTTRLAAIRSGQVETLDDHVVEQGRVRAQDDYAIREVIGLSICIKEALKKKLISFEMNPEELFEGLANIDKVHDHVVVEISDAFSLSREESIRAEEESYLTMLEILKDEVSKTDQRAEYLESQIESAQADLKEMQGFREALLNRLMNTGIAEESSSI